MYSISTYIWLISCRRVYDTWMAWVPLPLPQKKRQHWNLASKLPLSGQNWIIFHQPPRFPEKQGGFPFQKATIWGFSVVFSVAMKLDQIYHEQTTYLTRPKKNPTFHAPNLSQIHRWKLKAKLLKNDIQLEIWSTFLFGRHVYKHHYKVGPEPMVRNGMNP